jgi:hypothetical protein
MLTANQTYHTHHNLSAETALQKLIEGNDRYVRDHVEHPHEVANRTLKVVPAYYRLTTGKVDFLDLPRCPKSQNPVSHFSKPF